MKDAQDTQNTQDTEATQSSEYELNLVGVGLVHGLTSETLMLSFEGEDESARFGFKAGCNFDLGCSVDDACNRIGDMINHLLKGQDEIEGKLKAREVLHNIVKNAMGGAEDEVASPLAEPAN